MKKIILAATGEELMWAPWNSGGFLLCRENPPIAGHGFVFFSSDKYAYVYDTDDWGCNMRFWGKLPSREAAEQKAVDRGIIRIEETAEPEPGRTTQDYLLDEAEAIIKDVARTASGRACLDSARTLTFVVDLQNYRSGK